MKGNKLRKSFVIFKAELAEFSRFPISAHPRSLSRQSSVKSLTIAVRLRSKL